MTRSSRSGTAPWAVMLVVALLLSGCSQMMSDVERAVGGTPEEEIGNREREGQVGGILLTDSMQQASASKVIVTSYQVNAGGFTPQQALVTFGSQGLVAGGGEDYRVELVNAAGERLLDYSIWDPRKAVVEQQGIVVNPEANLAVRFPFRPEATRVRIRDAAGQIVAETEIRSVILEFCRRLRDDPDCVKVPRQ